MTTFETTVFAPPAPTNQASNRKERGIAFAQALARLAVNEGVALEQGLSQMASYANMFYAPRVFKTRSLNGKIWIVRTV